MSGLEGTAIAAAGGRLLGGLALPAARALARRRFFRWLVWWKVRKRVDFSCRWRTYRKWLKTLTAEELATPVEEIHGPLAIRLDEALSAASKDWTRADDHLSRALQLVELTYPAIAATLGEGDRAELSESWAQQRNVSVRDLLLQLVGPSAALSAGDLARVLQQRSRARREVRLQAFEIDEAVLVPCFDKIKVPDIRTGEVKVLLGDFGSGKSEAAETWHRAEIEELNTDELSPFPIWLNARDLLGQTLEDAVEHRIGPRWRHGRGASITIDGLDEANDPAKAQALLEDARILVRTFPNIRVLLTARPGILSPTSAEKTPAMLLTEDEALRLVESVSGKPYSTWRWTADMRTTVTRPFFALGAGVMLRQEELPHGEADLIRGLVENALRKGTERSTVTSAESRLVLTKLAVALTKTGKDGLIYSDRQVARSSGLVADGPDDSVRFSLPILQHWFAAQAILTGDVPAAEVVADARSFNRWRWAAAVTALSARDESSVNDLLGTWVSVNPGAGAWIIDTAFSGHRDWPAEGDEDRDAETSGTSFLRALRTWSDALGPLADGVLPWPVTEGPVGLGVTVSGRWIAVAFANLRPEADYVTAIPLGAHRQDSDSDPAWLRWIEGGTPPGHAWPWIMVKEMIARSMGNKVSRELLGAPEGVWVQEYRFDLARRLFGRGSGYDKDLAADQVREKAVELFDEIGRNRDAGISIRGSATISGAQLEDFTSWINTTAPAQLVSHLPKSDVPNPAEGWVWNVYSPQRLMEFEVEVYGRACEAYDEALEHSFARLGWSMPTSSIAPFGVVLEVQFGGARLGGIPGLTAVRVPMALMPQIAPSAPEAVWSASRRAVITQTSRERVVEQEHRAATFETIRTWLAEQNRELIGELWWTDTGTDDMSHGRPASAMAAGWLWDDLRGIGLGSGGDPQFR